MTKLNQLIAAVFAAPVLQDRLNQFLAINPSGLPGATRLRQRQEAARKRLQALQPQPGAAREPWQPRSVRFTLEARNELRARDTGDMQQALNLAMGYHHRIATLYGSTRATVVYAHKPQAITDWDAYAKSYGRPANYLNAACYVTYQGGAKVHMISTRNKEYIAPLTKGAIYAHPALLTGDLYGKLARPGIVKRYGPNDAFRGYAVEFPAIAGFRNTLTSTYWEHGATLAACRDEHAHKLEQARIAQGIAALKASQLRKARLIARLCGNLTCTIADARAAGYCWAGIDGFRERYNLGESCTLATLRGTRDQRVQAVIRRAAERCAQQEAL